MARFSFEIPIPRCCAEAWGFLKFRNFSFHLPPLFFYNFKTRFGAVVFVSFVSISKFRFRVIVSGRGVFQNFGIFLFFPLFFPNAKFRDAF